MMSDKLENSELRLISQMFELKMGQLDNTLKQQNKVFDEKISDLNKRMEKSDSHFDKRIDKLEEKLEKREQDIKLQEKEVVRLQTNTENTIKKTSALISAGVGIVAALLVAFVSKLLGLS